MNFQSAKAPATSPQTSNEPTQLRERRGFEERADPFATPEPAVFDGGGPPKVGHSLANFPISRQSTSVPPIQRAVEEDGLPGEAPLKTSRGIPLPDTVRGKMEQAFQTDFSDVRVHHGSEASRLNAKAYTQGTDIFFAPGNYHTASGEGQRLLAHELTHVMQQRAGQVGMPQGGGPPINADSHLESAADLAGEKAARGESAAGSALAGTPAPSAAAPVQRACNCHGQDKSTEDMSEP